LAFEKVNPPDALVRGLAVECKKLRKGLVIGCEANAHHTQWGCPYNNDRGESIFNFILNSNLFLCHRGNVTTFITKACQTIIDLTLVSDSLVGAVKNWAVSDEHSFSDHRLMETVLSLDSPLPVSFANPRRADWHRYKEVLTNHGTVRKHHKPTGAGRNSIKIHRGFQHCLQSCLPRKETKGKEKTPLVDPTLSILRNNCRCLFNRARAGNEDTN